MKNFKRIIALVLIMAAVLSFAGCHKKDEVAVTISDVKFTSAYYMCALINADSQAKNKVQESLSEEEKSGDKAIDFYSKKIDKKNYVEWVEDTAMENLKTIAAYKLLCKENKVKLNEDEIKTAETYADYYWSSYGYAAIFEPNGVGKATYTEYMKDNYYSEAYFEHLYGAEGKKAIDANTVKAKIYDNFITANILTASYTSEMDVEAKNAIVAQLDAYATDLKSGKKTFKAVYNEYNNITQEESQQETAEQTDVPKAKDEYASIIGAKDTAYAAEYYDTVKAMAIGEVKVIELADGAGLVLAIKQDITADEYYLTALDMNARHLIADEEFEKGIDDYVKKLKAEVNKFAVKQFKVNKIIEPSYN